MQLKVLEKDSFRYKFIQYYDKYLNLSTKQSIAIGIYNKGNFYAFGNGINKSYIYDIGSISKTIVAHLVLKLMHSNRINLNDTVDKYLNLKKGEYPKIEELLTHSAGYHNLTPIEFTIPSLIKHGYSKKNIYENIQKADVVKALEKRRKCKHKKVYGYSDFAYAILALVCEKVSGVSFSLLLEEFIQKELGMENTKLIINDNRYPLAVKGNKTVNFWHWEKDNPYLFSGGIISNLNDMLKYIFIQIESNEKYINDCHIVSDNVQTKDNILICKGWHTYRKSNQLWHVGGVGTFRSSIIINKEKHIGVVVLGNTKGISKANVHYLAKMIYSELKMKKIKL